MKLTKYILSFAAAAGLLAACQTPEIVQIAAPENVIPAALHELEVDDIAITATNQKETVQFSWEEANYGAKTALRYSVEVALTEDGKKVTIVPGTAETQATVTYEELNRVVFNDLNVAEGQPTELKVYVGSVIYSGAVTASYPKVYSQPISLTVTVTAAEKVYPKLTVAGSYAYNSWTPGKGQFVYDFEGNDAQFSGVIDFGEDVSALEFKFVGEAWGTNEFSVPSGAEQAAEAATLTLVSGGGDNISAYRTHRYYSFTLDKAAAKVTKNFSFNSLGVIGDATPTGWDADTDMIFNADKQRFYVDLTLTDGTIKFRADDDWALNWGGANGALVSGGDNISVTAGNYRIYVNLNDPANPTYELSKGMYGQDEPTSGTTTPDTPDTPAALVGWGLVGEFSGWADGADKMLASDGTYYVAKGVELSGQFKFRKDGGWATNFGAEGDVEPFELTANAETALVAGGKNFTIAAGTYDVYLDPENAKAWFINDGSYPGGAAAPEASPWALIGEFNSWNGDYPMYVEGEYHVAKGFEVTKDGKMKFRKDGKWNIPGEDGNDIQTNLGGTFAPNAALALTGGGSDLAVTAGTYDVYLKVAEDGQSGTAYFMTDGKKPSDAGAAPEPEPEPEPSELTWYLVGQFNNWTVGDAAYTMTKGTEWYVFKGFVSDGQGFKFNAGSWDVNRGATGDVEPYELTANTEDEIVANGKNFSIAAGTYDVYMDLETTKVYVMAQGLTPGQTPTPEEPEFEAQASEWGIVGVVNSWNAPDITMYTTPTNNLFVARDVNMPAGGFKIRANNKWDDTKNYGLQAAGDVEVDHVYNVITSGGSGDMTLAAGTYDIWFDLTNTKVYIMTPGKPISEAVVGGTVTPPAPAADVWGVVGTVTNWADKADINMTEDGDWLVAKSVALTATDEFKFRTNGTWGNERTAESADPVAVNTEYKAVAGSGNIKVAVAGTFDLYLAKSLDKFYVMEQGLTPGQTSEPEEPEFEAQASEWGVVGDVNGWNAPDITMYTTPTNNLFVARNVQMPAGGFKIRANGAWNDAANYGVEAAGNVEVDHVYKVITSGGSGNMTLVAGTYDIWFDLTNTKVYIMTPGKDISEAKTGTPVAPLTDTWYLVGDFNGWKAADATYKMSSEGTWYVFKNFTANGKGVKFVADANWSVNRGGTFKANAAISLSQGGTDMMVTAGTYDVYLSSDAKKAYFMTPGTKPAN